MRTDDKKLTWDKSKAEISFSVRDSITSSSALDSLKDGEIYYDSAGKSYTIGTTTGYKPIKISYDPIAATTKAVTKEQDQIETLIRAVTNLIKEIEELKTDNITILERAKCLEVENEGLRIDVNNLIRTSSDLEVKCNSQEKRIDYLIEEKNRLNAEVQLLKESKEDKKVEYDFKF